MHCYVWEDAIGWYRQRVWWRDLANENGELNCGYNQTDISIQLKEKKKSSDRDCWDLNKSFWWIRMFWTCGMTLIGSNVQQWTWMELIIKQRRRPRKTRWNGVEQDTETEGLVCPKLQTFGTNFICLFFIYGERKWSVGRLWKTAVRRVCMCVCRQAGREMHGSDVQRVAVGRSKI